MNRRLQIVLHLIAGGILAFAGVLVDYILGVRPAWGPHQTLLVVVGAGLALSPWIPAPAAFRALSSNLCLMLIMCASLLALVEGTFRVLRVDLARQEASWRSVPPYFRQPTVPTGEAFFRRQGPETYTGQVLNTRAEQLGVKPNPYRDEPAVTVAYNRLGFRNPEAAGDWDIAIAGDSFTELGYLTDDDIFTTRLARNLDARVLNLGVSFTGPLTQLSYLRDYGTSPSTRLALSVFFEGNDLEDLAREYHALARFQATGTREYREFKTQTSAIRALLSVIDSLNRRWISPTTYVEGQFQSADGNVPVTLTYSPPGSATLTPSSREQLEFYVRRFSEFSRERKIKAGIVFMPCKLRVLHGRIVFPETAPEHLRTWTPTDLPDYMRSLSRRYNVEFFDLTDALTNETAKRRRLLYNSVFDSHLNRDGSHIVASELASQLAQMVAGDPGQN